jgi:hypothetical protein
MRVYSPSGPAMAMGGANAAAFLLPLIVGVSITSFVLTATIALSPTAAELTAEAELMRRIGGGSLHPPTAVRAPVVAPPADRNPNFSKLVLRQ